MMQNNFYKKLKSSELIISAIIFSIFLLSAIDVFAADGDLDTSFDGDGKISTDLGSSGDAALDALVQPDGKLVLFGVQDSGSQNRFAIVRLNIDGSFDQTFGTGGKSIIENTNSRFGLVSGAVLQPDGKFLVSFNRLTPRVARVNANGSLDTTFGTNGLAVLPSGGNNFFSSAEEIILLPDGKILLGGTGFLLSPFTPGFAVARLDANGALDTTFGTNGLTLTTFDSSIGSANAFGMDRRADGKIALGGFGFRSGSQPEFLTKQIVTQYNADGSPDTTFGTNGQSIVSSLEDARITAVVFQTDGKLVAAGTTDDRSTLGVRGFFRRYTVGGAADAAFGTNGLSIVRVNGGATKFNDLAIQPDGKLIGFGQAFEQPGSYLGFAVLRVNTNGALDTTFGTGGFRTTIFSVATGASSEVYAGFLQQDGKIVAVGSENSQISGAGGANFAAARYLNSVGSPTIVNPTLRYADFDGDGKSDVSVFRGGTWFVNPSGSPSGFAPDAPSAAFGVQFGQAGDIVVPADYDGDGKSDIAVWRGAAFAYFYILNSSNNTFRAEQFGTSGDNPTVAGDWDADGKADLAVYRGGSQSFFYYRPTSQTGVNFVPVQWGTSGDTPIFGDFDGDRKLDAAVYRPSQNTFYVRQSSSGTMLSRQWGNASTDAIFAGDFDGDGKSDFAVQRFSGADAGTWYVAQSGGTNRAFQWGTGSDLPVPADYDGDGRTDFAVYRRSNGTWYIFQSATNTPRYSTFGAASDFPLQLNLVR